MEEWVELFDAGFSPADAVMDMLARHKYEFRVFQLGPGSKLFFHAYMMNIGATIVTNDMLELRATWLETGPLRKRADSGEWTELFSTERWNAWDIFNAAERRAYADARRDEQHAPLDKKFRAENDLSRYPSGATANIFASKAILRRSR